MKFSPLGGGEGGVFGLDKKRRREKNQLIVYYTELQPCPCTRLTIDKKSCVPYWALNSMIWEGKQWRKVLEQFPPMLHTNDLSCIYIIITRAMGASNPDFMKEFFSLVIQL